MPVTDYDHALVRAIPRRYAQAYARKGIHIDPGVAEAQHAAYVNALEHAGVTVNVLAGDEDFYDSVFVEDTAVVWRGRALITRMAKHREGEQRGVISTLGRTHEVSRLSAGSLLEGGDVLHTENATYVGLTTRTNERGAGELSEFLSTFGRRVVPVPLSTALHLKTVVTYMGNETLLAAPGHVDLRRFDVDEIVETAAGEEAAANCVRIRNTLLVRTRCPATFERLRAVADRHSVSLAPLDLSEFEKGDGSLTCLSLLWHENTRAARP